ncbi:MAG: site-specific integrase [Candidatus Bathyarchaeota archaeon]|nr:site-specific integrase [Candidatus Bathyarchaeum sp.]
METRIKNQAAGATKESEATINGKIVDYLWFMKKQGYAESTIETYVIILKTLKNRGADLSDPESVKTVIAQQQTWSKGRKWNVVKAYSLFLKMEGLTWIKPRYKPVEKIPFIPTENEIDQLISGCSKQLSTFLQVLKETAARRGEAFTLTWDDIDIVQKAIRITPEKGSCPRIFKISDKLLTMLNNLPRKDKKIWIYKTANNLSKSLRKQRKRIAHKTGNPRLHLIHFHTFRHWKATTEYAKTKDIMYVQKMLGHKNLKMTLRYTQFVSLPQNEEYICKVATTTEERKELIESGFTLVEQVDGKSFYSKRKTSYLGTESLLGGPWSSLD